MIKYTVVVSFIGGGNRSTQRKQHTCRKSLKKLYHIKFVSDLRQVGSFLQVCAKVCQWLAAGQWFSPVSSTNKTDW
jgi:hypothetical protein